MRIVGCPLAGTVIVCGLLFDGRVSASTYQTPAGARAATPGSARVSWLLFADDLHLDFVRTGQLRDILRTAASTLRGDGSPVGLRSSGPSMVSYAPSTDPAGLDAAIKRIAGNGLKATDFLVETVPDATRELRYRTHTTLAALHAAIASLASVPAPHKHIVFVSNGFTIVQPVRPTAPASPLAGPRQLSIDDRELLADIAVVAQASLDGVVTISALDPRLFIPGALDTLAVDGALWRSFVDASHHNLRELATPTGGTLLDGGQSLTDVLLALRSRGQR